MGASSLVHTICTQIYGNDENSVEEKALDLSNKIHGNNPEKCISLLEIFASKTKNVPKRPEFSTLKQRTLELIARLKNHKYGEVLTTNQVLKK